MTMACRGLEIFMGREKPIRSIQWIQVFAVTMILTSPLASTVSQGCPNGTYPLSDPSLQLQTTSQSSGTGLTAVTTSSWTETTSENCRNCSESIPQCIDCVLQDSSVICHQCEPGYDTSNNCTVPPSPPPSDKRKIIIGVVVGVCGFLIVVAVIVGIVFGVRRGAFEKCRCCDIERNDSPEPMPLPEGLGNSFTSKKDENQSGTGQRVDLRYTGEPGTTNPRVESVHYDRFKGTRDDDSVYVNSTGVNVPPTVPEDNDDTDDPDDQLYINAEGSTQINQSRSDKNPKTTKTTPVQGSSKPGPPRTKPKPKTAEKSISASNTKTGNKGSLFPPTRSEDIYTNKPDSEDDEDYVNSESYQPSKP